jgi:ubiquinone/menaquinone biosynthesis C-methylase UbiE
MGYVLLSPFRRRRHDPEAILAPFVRNGMTVLEPGPGMGFFTLPLARMVGPTGKVVAVDIQPKMLDALRRRARWHRLADRVDPRLADGAGLGVADLTGGVDFVLAFHVVHEVPDRGRFFAQVHAVLKPGGRMLVTEPEHHVTAEHFADSLAAARAAGFDVEPGPDIATSRTAVLSRP